MKHLLFLSFILTFCTCSLQAQDYLRELKSNPALFNQAGRAAMHHASALQSEEIRDSVIYEFDTLKLPFIDDFSKNHFYKDIASIPKANYTDTMFYKIKVGGNVYRGTEGFVIDTTYTYQLGASGNVLSKQANLLGFIKRFDLSSYPISSETVEIYKAFDVYDSLNGNRDTVVVKPSLFQDSAKYYFVDADTNTYYQDRQVYRNNHFPILPPSIGVATFDGLDENGLPYDIYNNLSVKADYLTSVPLQMGNLADTNVYISFFIQPKGRSLNGPEAEDSLALDFYNPTEKEWGTIWAVKGYKADTFKQHLVKVPNKFHKDGAQFRFRAYANSTGAFDQWHLDYIYLDANRSEKDTAYRDVAYVYEAPSLLKDFHAMPYWHFKANPGKFMIDSSGTILVKNNDDNGASVFNKVIIRDTLNNSEFYRYPSAPQLSIVQAFENFPFGYPINFAYASNDVDSAGTFAAEYTIRIGSQGSTDLISSNDTTYSSAILDNYYAYDDGTAEAGYGVNPENSTSGLSAFMAVEFNQDIVDTIGGIQLYFLPQYRDIRTQPFQIKIWAPAQNGGPGDLIFSKEKSFNPIFTKPNGFVTYWLDTLITVPQRYYVGIEAVGKYSMNIGYDLNNNHRDKIFWSYDGSEWYAPTSGIFDGSLMIRPIYHKSYWGVGLAENNLNNTDLLLYPNPTMGRFSLELRSELKPKALHLFNLKGQKVYQAPFRREVNLPDLSKGLYLLQLEMENGARLSKKVMLR